MLCFALGATGFHSLRASIHASASLPLRCLQMGFWSSVIRVVSPSCGQNSTSFAVRALQQLLRRNDTVRQLDAQSYYVGQQLNGSYAVRVLPTGDTGTYCLTPPSPPACLLASLIQMLPGLPVGCMAVPLILP